MATSREIKEEYTSSLSDLTFNSKPLITMLTMLAEENAAHARDIVEAIEAHLAKVRTEVKLPVLYLIDCIMKNVGGSYTSLFSQNIVPTFCSVFELVDERTRAEMFRLRQTWNDIIPPKKLYALDVQINMLDPAWPVITPPPNNSIHFNPKFLMNKTSSTTAKTKKETTTVSSSKPIIPVTSTASLDPATLDMQQKLINKQRELLELQQKKLELELLQTQVKLQEQLKNASSVSQVQNILLKPEVAKQLVKNTPTAKSTVPSAIVKPLATTTSAPSTIVTQKLQNTSAGPRIAPVNSALVAASSRPIRDPRLLRQQQQHQQQQQQKLVNINSSNVQLESKQQTIDSNNKIVNNKMGVRDNRTEPRLLNKNNVPSQDKSNKTVPRSPSKTISKHPEMSTSRKTIKSSRNSSKTSSESSDSKGGSSKSSTSSLDSPSKIKIDSKSQSPSKLPPKHKKKESSSHCDKKSSNKTSKSDKTSKSHNKSDSSPTTFKDLKGSTKNRNYMRRNRNSSASPEPTTTRDVDLRLNGPPEKQQRLQGDPDEKSTKVSPCMDVDLRQLPGVVGKKRSSTELIEGPNAKKSKNEIFDVLFGGEDTDLRQLSTVMSPPTNQSITERPPTPPPPIISTPYGKEENDKKEVEQKDHKLANFDALRAKLANAIGKSKEMKTDERKVSEVPVDVDLRNKSSPKKQINKIFISPADEERIKAGNMTKAQEKALMNKIFAQIETQKLREAQKKEEENFGNVSLQPISDDELEADFSGDETNQPRDKSQVLQDKDERVPPFHVNPSEDVYPKFQRTTDGREIRRSITHWSGRRRHFENSPHLNAPRMRVRQGPEPWIRMNPNHGPWRPMGPNFIRPPLNQDNFVPIVDDNLNRPKGGLSPNQNSQDASDILIDCALQDNMKTINIDGIPRDIRYYEETAIVFINWDEPREISFQNGSRRIIFDDKESFLLSFNEPYREVNINGNVHMIKLGAPTRELYIDGKWYECYFGGSGIGIELNGKLTVVKMEGPPPQVKIGKDKRTDLVVAKVSLIIDAKNIVPVFLDARPQKFDIDGKVHTLRFIEALKTALINDVPFKVEFGGLPKPITVHDKKHFIRFSVLPRGVKPGSVYIKDMEGCQPIDTIRIDENSQDSHPAFETNFDVNEPALPVISKKKKVSGDVTPERNSNSPQLFQNMLQQQNFTDNLDVLSNVISTAMTTNTSAGGYQVENIPASDSTSFTPVESQAVPAAPKTVQPLLPSGININELFQKLVATGIVTTTTQESVVPPPAAANAVSSTSKPIVNKKDSHGLKPVYFDKPETLKVRQSALYQMLYSGMQCSSCGMRFPPEHSMQYSQHLDWHFRQNRKGKKNIRKAASRRWYYSLSDWKNYEEIEDLEEREKSYFDQQQSQGDGVTEEMEEEIEIPSVPADPNVQNAQCEVCRDKFEQFYNEEKEEWHLRMAIRVEEKTYHPLCYEDYQSSLANATIDEVEMTENSGADGEEKIIPGLEVVIDDDSEIKSVKDVDEVIIEESDDSKLTSEDKQAAEEEEIEEESHFNQDDDDDVILNEVVPEKIIVDDEDDKEEENINILKDIVIKKEPIDDGFIELEDGVLKVKNDGEIKIKSEPIDNSVFEDTLRDSCYPNDSLIETVKSNVDTTHTELVSSMDGNVELEVSVPTTTAAISGKIKINISKPLPVILPKENKEVPSESDITTDSFIDPSQPLPPGEEPVQLNLKPRLVGVNLKKLPPVKKGSELTGLCSIM